MEQLPPTGTFQSLNEWSVVDPHYFYADPDTDSVSDTDPDPRIN
jgi:hypothetical protein